MSEGTDRMDTMENKVEYVVTRSEVENVFREFTDKEWVVIAGEIENIFYHYLWSDLPNIVEDLPSLLEEYEAYS